MVETLERIPRERFYALEIMYADKRVRWGAPLLETRKQVEDLLMQGEFASYVSSFQFDDNSLMHIVHLQKGEQPVEEAIMITESPSD
jgi:hypothetical protein